jgi:hypothetical protein
MLVLNSIKELFLLWRGGGTFTYVPPLITRLEWTNIKKYAVYQWLYASISFYSQFVANEHTFSTLNYAIHQLTVEKSYNSWLMYIFPTGTNWKFVLQTSDLIRWTAQALVQPPRELFMNSYTSSATQQNFWSLRSSQTSSHDRVHALSNICRPTTKEKT